MAHTSASRTTVGKRPSERSVRAQAARHGPSSTGRAAKSGRSAAAASPSSGGSGVFVSSLEPDAGPSEETETQEMPMWWS